MLKRRSLLSVAAIGIALATLTGCISGEPAELKGGEPSKHVSINEDAENGAFDNDVLTVEGMAVEVTDATVIPVGEKGSELGETAVLRIDFEATNISDYEFDVMSAWFSHFRAIQEIEENSIAELGIAASSIDNVAELEMIAKGKSGKGWVSYQVMYEDVPVQLIASDSSSKKVATIEYKLK